MPSSLKPQLLSGSRWRKWDLHVHTPDTAMEDRFTGWAKYLAALRAEKEVAVLGVTDYMTIVNYKRVLAEHNHAPLGSISCLIPNIEFRLTPQTDRGHAINMHLLIDPSSTDHVANIESALTRLHFSYNDRRYSCTPPEFIRLGAAINPTHTDDEAKYKAGVEQFKVEFATFSKWLSSEGWLKEHCLVAVAGGNDGPSGIRDGGWVAAQEEIWRLADIVLTANDSNRAYWLCEKPASADAARSIGAPKPCISGSDAHSLETLFKTTDEKYCWIKADPTFEGLRSIVYEPKERVHIGPRAPISHDLSRVIAKVDISHPKAEGFDEVSIPLNNGLVSIIGSKGSGKSALTDLISYASGVNSESDKRSFICRAKSFIKGTTITLTWGDGTTTTAIVGSSLPDRPLIRYLSQSFVEQLCSDDYAGVSLTEEIEDVIFGHLDATDTLDASSFKELKDIRTQETQKERTNASGRIKSLVGEETRLRAVLKEVPAKKQRIQDIAAETKLTQMQMPEAKSDAEAQAQARLTELRAKILKVQSNIARQKQLSLGLDQLTALLHRQRADFNFFKEDFLEAASKLGLPPGSVTVDIVVTGEETIAARKQSVETAIQSLERDDAQSGGSLNALNVELLKVEASVNSDQVLRNQIQHIQKKLSALNQELQRLQAEVFTAETETKAQLEKLRNERLNVYKSIFASWQTEQVTLEGLYKPVQGKLSSGRPEEQELDFYIRREVDTRSWLERGNSFFDQRKGHPFGSPNAFREVVERTVEKGWKSGDPEAVRAGMDELLTELREHKVENFLKQSTSLATLLDWVFSYEHIQLAYGLRYYKTELEKLSPGTKGIVLLVLYLAMDTEDTRPLIVDQPEENLDSESIYSLLAGYFRKAKQRRQVILVTHNPNLVVNTDSEQVIVASSSRKAGVFPDFSYMGGALEDCDGIRKRVCDILEGGEKAFLERERRYALN